MRSDRNLILCGGMSEYLYSKSLQMELPEDVRCQVSIERAFHCTDSPIALVREGIAKKRQSGIDRNPYANIWLFFQNSQWEPTVSDLIERNNFRPAYCPICIEQWYYLHFREHSGTAKTANDVNRELQALWPDYKKNRIDAFQALKNMLPVAVQHSNEENINAASVQPMNPFPLFTVQNLISFFDGLKLAS